MEFYFPKILYLKLGGLISFWGPKIFSFLYLPREICPGVQPYFHSLGSTTKGDWGFHNPEEVLFKIFVLGNNWAGSKAFISFPNGRGAGFLFQQRKPHFFFPGSIFIQYGVGAPTRFFFGGYLWGQDPKYCGHHIF